MNNYSAFETETLREKLKQYSKVFFYSRDNIKGCSERFYPLQFTNYDGTYIAFADDDLIYPPFYLKSLISGAEKYQCLVSWHGRILKKGNATNYYRHYEAVHACLRTVNEDVEVDIVGCGASLVKRSLINGIEKYYNSIEYGNMDDIYYSYLAKQNGLKRMVLAHNEGDLKHKEMVVGDGYIYDSLKNNCQPQTDFINKYF
jgi:hypothetical protein